MFYQSVGLPKWSSTEIRNQDVHTNGCVLDDIILSDPEVEPSSILGESLFACVMIDSSRQVFASAITVLVIMDYNPDLQLAMNP